jgi:hypothetical protein
MGQNRLKSNRFKRNPIGSSGKEISIQELRKRNEELAKSYNDNDTTMGENNIPVTDSTVSKSNLDYPVRPRGEERGKFKFKMPKLKFSGFSGSGKRTAMRGKIK